MQKIIPHLWFDSQAEEAAQFYTSLFPGSTIKGVARFGKEGFEMHGRPAGSAMTVEFELAGLELMALNGGPHFKFTPAISLSVIFDTEAETDALWEKLSDGGHALMELGKYDWSEKYGWIADKYGLSWQITTVPGVKPGQTITPSFLFVDKKFGQAEEAINHYMSIFKDSRKGNLFRGPADPANAHEHLMYGDFYLHGERFAAMDGPGVHGYSFNEAVSLMINCEDQEEVDYFWEKLSEGGREDQCGWLKDKFGVSWQVVPKILNEMMLDPDEEKVARVTRAFMQMRKFDVRKLEEAYRGEQPV